MSLIFLGSIFVFIFLFGGVILVGLAIWALLSKKEALPLWAKSILWLFVALAAVLLVAGVASIFYFTGVF
mgnify:CR=1 FL=1